MIIKKLKFGKKLEKFIMIALENDKEIIKSYKRLVIVGNGFDLNLKLKTKYTDFENFMKTKVDQNEIQFLNFVYPNLCETQCDLWSNLEASLAEIDIDRFITFFGNSYDDAEDVKRYLNDMKESIFKNFKDWIEKVNNSIINSDIKVQEFGEDCLFINFNYTSTLQKYYGVCENDIIFVHGSVEAGDEIVMGHNQFDEIKNNLYYPLPQEPYGVIMNHLKSYFRDTDKNVAHNIRKLEEKCNGRIKELFSGISEVYVLGHSLNKVDQNYFKFFNSILSKDCAKKCVLRAAGVASLEGVEPSLRSFYWF